MSHALYHLPVIYATHNTKNQHQLFQAAAHLAQARLLIERHIRSSRSPELQPLSDGLNACVFLLERRSRGGR
jgi:acetyl/propionyl-CoA carboxylase alpha subunit